MNFSYENKYWMFDFDSGRELIELVNWLEDNSIGTYKLTINSFTTKSGGGKYGSVNFGNMKDALAFKLSWT